MRRICLVMSMALLSACAVEVYGDGKSREQTKRDIETCSRHGKLVSPYEPISALNAAYRCLEAKGYKRRSLPPHLGAGAAAHQ